MHARRARAARAAGPARRAMLNQRWWRWCALSGGLLAIIVGEGLCAAGGRRSAFETFMAIATSKPRLMVVCNALLAASVTVAAFVASLLFGPLRRTEYEYLADRCKAGLIEFFLTLAMFRHTMTCADRSLSLTTRLRAGHTPRYSLASVGPRD